MTSNAQFLRRSISLAVENVRLRTGGPFGAVVVRDGAIVAEGANSVTMALDPTAHAEVNAIRAACKVLGTFNLSGCQLYSSCEPCPMCLAACYWARLDQVFYGCSAADAARAGFDDARLYRELLRGAGERSLPMSQLLEEEALASFAAWREAADKVSY